MHQASSIGGGSYCLLNIVRSLDTTIWEPIVALKTHGPLADELVKQGIRVIFFKRMTDIPYNLPLTPRMVFKYFRVIASLHSFKIFLSHERIDVLYLNNMMLSPYLKPAKTVGCKTVVHVREHWPLNEHKKQLEWVRKIVYNDCDSLIAINHYSAGIFPKKEAAIIYDWIDLISRNKKISLSDIFGENLDGKKVLLYTGGDQYIKGTDYVINSFTRVIKGNDYRLLILGWDLSKRPKGWRHTLKMITTLFGGHYYEMEIRKRVLEDKRIKCVPGIYEISNIIEQSFCYVSYYRIAHANLSLAENIIMGNPSIVADNEEAREYSNNGHFAMLVTPNQENVFAEKLLAFINDIKYWKGAAVQGAESVANMFDKKSNIEKLHKILNALI